MKEQNRSENIHHHHYNWSRSLNQILLFLILVIAVVTVLSWVTTIINEHKSIYSDCVDSCSKKHFSDYEVGVNFNSNSYVTNPNSNRMVIYKPTIDEFDRTPCIASCNKLLLELKQ